MGKKDMAGSVFGWVFLVLVVCGAVYSLYIDILAYRRRQQALDQCLYDRDDGGVACAMSLLDSMPQHLGRNLYLATILAALVTTVLRTLVRVPWMKTSILTFLLSFWTLVTNDLLLAQFSNGAIQTLRSYLDRLRCPTPVLPDKASTITEEEAVPEIGRPPAAFPLEDLSSFPQVKAEEVGKYMSYLDNLLRKVELPALHIVSIFRKTHNTNVLMLVVTPEPLQLNLMWLDVHKQHFLKGTTPDRAQLHGMSQMERMLGLNTWTLTPCEESLPFPHPPTSVHRVVWKKAPDIQLFLAHGAALQDAADPLPWSLWVRIPDGSVVLLLDQLIMMTDGMFGPTIHGLRIVTYHPGEGRLLYVDVDPKGALLSGPHPM